MSESWPLDAVSCGMFPSFPSCSRCSPATDIRRFLDAALRDADSTSTSRPTHIPVSASQTTIRSGDPHSASGSAQPLPTAAQAAVHDAPSDERLRLLERGVQELRESVQTLAASLHSLKQSLLDRQSARMQIMQALRGGNSTSATAELRADPRVDGPNNAVTAPTLRTPSNSRAARPVKKSTQSKKV